jgi:phospholipid/cholesterol/gamma-HCH transport system substrate-binding protein
MDQSKSSDKQSESKIEIPIPKRNFSLEFFVGLFTMVGCAAIGYLAIGLGGIDFGSSNYYIIHAEFDNVSGLKQGASVELAGVQVGSVSELRLKDPMADVVLKLDKGFRIRDDDIASIRTKGIIGDRYVKISRGGSDKYLSDGARMTETESVVDIEDIIGKIVHSLSGDKEDKDKDKEKEAPDAKSKGAVDSKNT